MHTTSKERITWCITTFHFQLLRTLLVTFQTKNSVRRAPANTALTKSHTEAIKLVLQNVTYVVAEKGMEHKGEQTQGKL